MITYEQFFEFKKEDYVSQRHEIIALYRLPMDPLIDAEYDFIDNLFEFSDALYDNKHFEDIWEFLPILRENQFEVYKEFCQYSFKTHFYYAVREGSEADLSFVLNMLKEIEEPELSIEHVFTYYAFKGSPANFDWLEEIDTEDPIEMVLEMKEALLDHEANPDNPYDESAFKDLWGFQSDENKVRQNRWLADQFAGYLQQNGLPFSTAYWMGNYAFEFVEMYEDENLTLVQSLIDVEKADLEKLTQDKGFDFYDPTYERIFSCYTTMLLVKFFEKHELLSSDQADASFTKIKKVKHEFFASDYGFMLWTCDYIKTWPTTPPFDVLDLPFDLQVLSDSYDKIDRPAFKKPPLKLHPLLAGLMPKLASGSNKEEPVKKVVQPRPTGTKKIGRNDKVNVRYKDGKIVSDVKYKKVEQDVIKGLCVVIQ
jgi:hypothetical protein